MTTAYRYELGKFVITEEMKDGFNKDGYIVVRNIFNQSEVEKIKTTIMENGMLKYGYKVPDADGRSPIMALWQHPGNDVTGMVGRCEKIITTAEKLLDVEELYHYHGKYILKEPLVGGKFEWHQDYGYWYRYCLRPDMMAVFIAVDPCMKENGCLVVLKGSHQYQRVDHGFSGGQQGADLERVEEIKKVCPLVEVECAAGDAIFFHSNLLHCSGPNTSTTRRLALNISLNEKNNGPVKKNICPDYTKIDKVPDTAIIDCPNMSDFTGKNFITPEDDELVKSKNTEEK